MKKFLFFLSCVFYSATALGSFDFSPISLSLGTTGFLAVGNFTVKNTSDRKVPIQIYIVSRDPDINGKEVYNETPEIDDLFQIYPSQVVLNPGEKRSVRVTWTGGGALKKEMSYRIISEELPFEVDEPNKTYSKPVANVKIASKYIGSLYVTPTGSQPTLVAKAQPSHEEKPQLLLEIENQGTAHQVIQKSSLKLTSAATKTTVDISGTVLDNLLYNQNVLAGKTRRFILPWPQGLPVSPVKASFELLKN